MSVPYTLRITCLALLLSVCGTGCVALSIPSQRLHDPDDHGGLLGDWRRGRPHTAAHQTEAIVESGGMVRQAEPCGNGACQSDPNSPAFVADGAMAMDIDPTCGHGNKAEQPPKVPWPRYHPIPTRPVFGGQ